jgi:hypothetical protein
LAQLDAQLAASPFLLGSAPCIADFSAYHPLWFIQQSSPATLEPYAHVAAWMARIAAFGHGKSTDLSSHGALELCRGSRPRSRQGTLEKDPNGVTIGTRVMVRATDLGRDPIEGELVHIETDSFAIERTDDRAGTATVHFPRVGYEIKPI